MIYRKNLSSKNKYKISKHRMMELRHFCFQYPDWKKEYLYFSYYPKASEEEIKGTDTTDPTFNLAEKRLRLSKKMEIVEQAVSEVAPDFFEAFLYGVTNDISYEAIKYRYDIPLSKASYYRYYRKFFYILDKKKW